MYLPGLPGSDTATVAADYVSGSGCQVGIEITDTSDPRGGQPGDIGIDVTLPDTWNGNYMAEGNGVYRSRRASSPSPPTSGSVPGMRSRRTTAATPTQRTR